jgi:hypothetical protein
MSAEAFRSFERAFDPEEQIQGVEVATRSIVRIRLLLAEHGARLELERAQKAVDLEIIKHLTDAIKELERELEDALAFLEEFDPILFQKMKDNS